MDDLKNACRPPGNTAEQHVAPLRAPPGTPNSPPTADQSVTSTESLERGNTPWVCLRARRADSSDSADDPKKRWGRTRAHGLRELELGHKHGVTPDLDEGSGFSADWGKAPGTHSADCGGLSDKRGVQQELDEGLD